jgi:hypothetical protein
MRKVLKKRGAFPNVTGTVKLTPHWQDKTDPLYRKRVVLNEARDVRTGELRGNPGKAPTGDEHQSH